MENTSLREYLSTRSHSEDCMNGKLPGSKTSWFDAFQNALVENLPVSTHSEQCEKDRKRDLNACHMHVRDGTQIYVVATLPMEKCSFLTRSTHKVRTFSHYNICHAST